jgi:hypothetical protein
MRIPSTRHSRSFLSVVALALVTLSPTVHASWNVDGNPVCTEPHNQVNSTIVSDGASGAYVFWTDTRVTGSDIYGQRIDSSGVVRWSGDGIAVCSASSTQNGPAAAPASGGAVVCWSDGRNSASGIYAQRVNANGVGQWTSNGVALGTTTTDFVYSPRIVPDGAGGINVVPAFLSAWILQTSFSIEVRAQRINYDGVGMWTAATSGGAQLVSASSDQIQSIAMTSDGVGVSVVAKGAFVTWQRDGTSTVFDIYVRRVDSSGAVQWGNPLLVCGTNGDQEHPAIALVGAGTVILAWDDFRAASRDIWAQKVNSTGSALWTGNGEPVCRATGHQQLPQVVSDDTGGVIIVWEDGRFGADRKIFAQRIDTNGARVWALDGIQVCNHVGDQAAPVLVRDLAGGAVIAWLDGRDGNTNIFAQRLNSSGNPLWPADGVSLTRAAGTQNDVHLVGDSHGGALASWTDGRIGGPTNNDIYVARANAVGSTVGVAGAGPSLQLLSLLSSNPTRGSVRLRLELPEAAALTVDVMDAQGRRVRSLHAGVPFAAGAHLIEWDGADASGKRAAAGLYFVRARTDAATMVTRIVALR